MAHEKAIAEGFDALWGKSSERNWILGRLGLPGGGTPVFDVPDKPGYKYVNRGAAGEQGQVIARNPIGVADIYNQRVRMRREFGEYVIREAEEITGGSGGGGGSSTLAGLSDVNITSPANGNLLGYDSGTGTWIDIVPAAGVSWTAGVGIAISGSVISTKQYSAGGLTADSSGLSILINPATALASNSSGLRLLTAATGAINSDAGGLRVVTPTNSGLIVDATGLRVGAPGTLDTGSVNQLVGTSHFHDIDSSSNPGATAKVLQTSANGSLQIDTNLLNVDAGANRVGINRVPSGVALDIIAANTSDVTQRIKQIVGQTQRLWRVEDAAGQELIVLDSVGDLQSGQPGFVSGLRGWQITPGGNAEFNNIWARGELHATVFVKDEIHAIGGSILVATADNLYNDAVIDSTTSDTEVFEVLSIPVSATPAYVTPLEIVTTSAPFSGTTMDMRAVLNYLDMNDPPSGPASYFQPDEIVRVKTEVPTFGVPDLWFTINSFHQMSGYGRYSVTKRSGSDATIPKGTAVVSYGLPGDGRIMMTSDWRKDDGYPPYIDVFTTGAHPWDADDVTGIVPRVRMGQLKGVGLNGVSGISQFGIVMSTDLSNANAPHIIASNLQLLLNKVNLQLYNGLLHTGEWTADGNMRLGSDLADPAKTSMQVFTTNGSGGNAGDVIIGHTSSDYMKWDQVAGRLTVVGDVQVAGRVQQVGGVWTSVDVDTVSWTGVTVRLGSGAVLSVIDGNTGNITLQRRYLFINVTTLSAQSFLGVETLTDPLVTGNHALIAVCDKGVAADTTNPAGGSGKASISIVAGSTYISGDNIISGSIVSNQIAAGAIKANKIDVTTLSAVAINTGALSITGALDMSPTGMIRGGGKNYGSATPGFFLGYDAGQYKFQVGGTVGADFSNLQWDGTNLSLTTTQAISVNNTSTGQILSMRGPGSTAGLLTLNASQVLVSSTNIQAPEVSAPKLFNTGTTFQISQNRTPASPTDTGVKGDICWDSGYFYVCIATNAWRRIPMFSTGTYW